MCVHRYERAVMPDISCVVCMLVDLGYLTRVQLRLRV